MSVTLYHPRCIAGTSFTKACIRRACAVRPVAGSHMNQQWNKATGTGFAA